MKKLPKELKALLRPAIKALNAKGIKGGIYHYKRGECSCCYPTEGEWKDHDFLIQMNTAGNQGGESAGRITFTEKHSNAIARALYEALDANGHTARRWALAWNGDTSTVMELVEVEQHDHEVF